MSIQHLITMEVSEERVLAAVNFLTDYGSMCVTEADHDRDAQVRGISEEEQDRRWTLLADAASSFREAGQWALCFDPQRGRELLDRAGDIFYRLGYPFGAYLLVSTGTWAGHAPARDLGRSIDWVTYLNGLGEGPPDERNLAPLQHPQQQAYLALACAGSPFIAHELDARLGLLLDRSPQRSGVSPVGALGTPARRYWETAAALHRVTGDETAVNTIADHVTAMSRRFAEASELAMANAHTWTNASAPVDIGDIDIVGTTAMAARRFGVTAMQGALDRRSDGLPRFARIQLEIAMEFARAGLDHELSA
jgi:hypothetical protein